MTSRLKGLCSSHIITPNPYHKPLVFHWRFPFSMEKCKIVPVHKSGSKSRFDNYSSLSILPVLSKTIEKLVHQQLMKFLDENRLLSEFQFGLKPRMSTELAATLFLDNIGKKSIGDLWLVLFSSTSLISHLSGASLNRELLQGQDLTNLLVAVLIRFRIQKVAFLADIESMFYKVQVPKPQRSYLRLLWWPD